MTQKVVLISDPGIDGAFAISLALFDPDRSRWAARHRGECAGRSGHQEHAHCACTARSGPLASPRGGAQSGLPHRRQKTARTARTRHTDFPVLHHLSPPARNCSRNWSGNIPMN